MDEVRQTPDDSTRRRIGFTENLPPLHLVLCDSLNADGAPWECCTRGFMRRALADLEAETGLRLHIAYENEFLLTGEGMEWAAPFSVDSIRRVASFADLCTAALLDADVGLETFEPEYGVGQYEVSCGPATGVSGADRVVITRETVREAARQRASRRSQRPTPWGNGCHLHLSLWDGKGQAAAFDPDGPGQLSPVAAQFVAGVQRHLPALAALTAPSPVSYLRLGPRHWACGYDAVGVQNREGRNPHLSLARPRAPPRGPTPSTSKSARPTRRPAPTVAVGAVARAGLEGIRASLPAPTMIDEDPDEMGAGKRAELGVKELPSSLAAALDALTADETARGWFTPTMLEAYTSLKRLEAETYAASTPGRMCERYARAY